MAALTEQPESDDNEINNNGAKHNFNEILHRKGLPKILYSMKSERNIASTVLDQFDGFLTKPLDIGLLLSELVRLAQPTLKTLQPKKPAESTEDNIGKTEDINNNKNAGSVAKTLEDNPFTNDQIVDSQSINSDPSTTISEPVTPLILVVEDNITNQKITCKMLSKLGYRSVVAEDGLQALEKLQEQRQNFALILMDCRMPVMDGLQATQAIRDNGDNITIIALTANNTDEDREACLAVGMDEFLAKPINKDKLQAVLQQFISA